jgi:predicted oxidoreductase
MDWAKHYVERSGSEVYDWLLTEGFKFLPAVNWVERGRFGEGNSLPRYHMIWGCARELVRCMIAALHRADSGGRLRCCIGIRLPCRCITLAARWSGRWRATMRPPAPACV